MKKGILKNLFLTLVIAMFVVSFVSVVMSVETQETTTIKGTVININADTGKVLIKNESGDVLALTAGSEINLATYNESDKVIIAATFDGIIKSINKMDQPG